MMHKSIRILKISFKLFPLQDCIFLWACVFYLGRMYNEYFCNEVEIPENIIIIIIKLLGSFVEKSKFQIITDTLIKYCCRLRFILLKQQCLFLNTGKN